ncbi:winged helix-turn-helix transcriptional regulator [Nitriliruptoraceae bacterium ZYF776]|nr:winged helix-turn-helix transcriptional regulator [Profundirhabdus halotolerans]
MRHPPADRSPSAARPSRGAHLPMATSPLGPVDPVETAASPGGLPDADALATAVAITDVLDTLLEVGPEAVDGIEDRTGLRLGQLRVLHVVRTGTDRPRRIAERTGEHLDTTVATIATLQRAGLLLGDAFDPMDGPVRLTEAGRARLDQLAALQLRLVAELPPSLSRRLLASVRVLVARLAEVERLAFLPLPPPA